MLVTKQKPFEEVLAGMEGEKAVFIVACCGCPEGVGTGGKEEASEYAERLRGGGKKVTGIACIDFLCNKALVGVRLNRVLDGIRQADSALVISCGIGVQAVSAMLGKLVHPALDTISMGGMQGLWPGVERCGECGECRLDYTGGICPVTACSKSLLTGQCGGAKSGKCEVDSEKECGWQRIYERLAELGQTDRLRRPAALRDFSKMDFPTGLKTTIRWALEVEEQPAAAGE